MYQDVSLGQSSERFTRNEDCCLSVRVAQDPDEHARNLTGWKQQYDQLSRGQFLGSLTELRLDKTQIFKETTSHTIRQSCEIPKNSVWFGIPKSGGDSFIGRNRITDDMIALRPDGDEFKLLTPDSFEILGVVVEKDVLVRYAREMEQVELDPALAHGEVLRIGIKYKDDLCRFMLQVLAESQRNTALHLHAASRNALRDALLTRLLGLFSQQVKPYSMPTLNINHYRVVAGIRDYIIANRDHAITVPDLCRQFCVSRRTLQYCFQEVLGMPPAAYLRTIRLNGARRDLRNTASCHATVQDIAAAWGFWHLSQFASDYKDLFGELPSASLRARSL